MKKYPNITKYFNTIPRTFLLIGLIIYTSITIVFHWRLFVVGRTPIVIQLILLSVSVLLIVYMANAYYVQFSLERARIGKHFKKYLGFSKEEVAAALTQINSELERPVYSDINPKRKKCCFFITNNWVIGTDGAAALRVNAVRIADIKSVDKGGDTYSCTLEVRDNRNWGYYFHLSSYQHVNMAVKYLNNILNSDNAIGNDVINIDGIIYPKINFEIVNELLNKSEKAKAVKELSEIAGLNLAEAEYVANNWDAYWRNEAKPKPVQKKIEKFLGESPSNKRLIISRVLIRLLITILFLGIAFLAVLTDDVDNGVYVRLGIIFAVVLPYILAPLKHWNDKLCFYSNKITLGKYSVEFDNIGEVRFKRWKKDRTHQFIFNEAEERKAVNQLSNRINLDITYILRPRDGFIDAYMNQI